MNRHNVEYIAFIFKINHYSLFRYLNNHCNEYFNFIDISDLIHDHLFQIFLRSILPHHKILRIMDRIIRRNWPKIIFFFKLFPIPRNLSSKCYTIYNSIMDNWPYIYIYNPLKLIKNYLLLPNFTPLLYTTSKPVIKLLHNILRKTLYIIHRIIHSPRIPRKHQRISADHVHFPKPVPPPCPPRSSSSCCLPTSDNHWFIRPSKSSRGRARPVIKFDLRINNRCTRAPMINEQN